MISDYASDTGACQALLAKRKSPRPLAIYINSSTIGDMKEQTFDDKAAELLDRALYESGRVEDELGKALGLMRQAVNDYINRKTKRWPADRLQAAERFLKRRVIPDGQITSRPETPKASIAARHPGRRLQD